MKAPAHVSVNAAPLDWALFAALVAIGGSAFALIRTAVETMPPAAVAVGRLWVGAGFLYLVMRQAGRRFPPLLIRTTTRARMRRSWRWMIAVGVTGNVAPFFLFPWAQQHIESGLAGIYMAFMPIWTVVLAHVYAGEAMTFRKLFGFGLGFFGVVILMGPKALTGVIDADLRAQGALLLATLFYAVSAILARRAPPIRPRVFSAGMMLSAAVAASPAIAFFDMRVADWSLASMGSVAALGLFCTGLAGFLIINMIRRVGAGFMSLANYIIPVWAVLVGVVLFGERIGPNALVALVAILAGVAVSQRDAGPRRTVFAPKTSSAAQRKI